VARIQVLNVAEDRLESATGKEASLYNPHWSPDGARIVYMATDTGHPPTIAVSRPDGSERRPITAHPDYTMAQSIAYQSAVGLAIPAYLYEPAPCRTAKCAALVWLHGGLGALYANAFDRQAQYFVNQGFVVLAPNYRSSGGYSKELGLVDATG